jgi:hypothetical protein
VQVDGAAAGTEAIGFAIVGGGSLVRGLVIQNFTACAVVLGGGGNRIENNYIGSDVSGVNSRPNGVGVILVSSGNLIGGTSEGTRNVISGNASSGIVIGRNSENNRIQGNFIGTDRDGTQPLANATGVFILAGRKNQIGGTQLGEGNVISGNSGPGIHFDSSRPQGDLKIEGNFIGTNPTGTAAVPNETGILIATDDVKIGGEKLESRNVISGNNSDGVRIGKASNVRVQGNYIGVAASGASALPNGENGIWIYDGAKSQIGGERENEGNIVSGNRKNGILITGERVTASRVEGNIIGLGAAATLIPNESNGIFLLDSPGNAIGGDKPGTLNVISGNLLAGIRIEGATAKENTVERNFVGLDRTGEIIRANSEVGIDILGAGSNQIGGGNSSNGPRGNFICGSAVGIRIAARGTSLARTVIEGNTIGINTLGEAASNGSGIDVGDLVIATIGGLRPDLANTIAFNLLAGVRLTGVNATAILRNSIHSTQQGLGIEQSQEMPTPLLTSIETRANGKTAVVGRLAGSPGRTYRVEFFSNDVPDPSGRGEGQKFLGARDFPVVSDDPIDFRVKVPADARNISATATSYDEVVRSAFDRTSGFSNTLTMASPAALASAVDSRNSPTGRILRFVEADGDAVTIRSTNGGELQWTGRAIPELTVTPKRSQGRIVIAVQRGASGNGYADVDRLIVRGDLRALSAPHVNFLGGIHVSGFLGRATIGNLMQGSRLETGGAPPQQTRLAIRSLATGAVIQSSAEIDILTVDSISGSEVRAPRIGKLLVREIIDGATIAADEQISSLRTRALARSLVSAGYTPTDAMRPLEGGEFLEDARIGSVNIGELTGSLLIAPQIGRMNIRVLRSSPSSAVSGTFAPFSLGPIQIRYPSWSSRSTESLIQPPAGFRIGR